MITIRQLNPGSCKTYVVAAQGSRSVVLVDPVLERVPEYLRLLDTGELALSHVFDTHTHADHISGSALLKEKTGCAYVMHRASGVACVTDRVSEGTEIIGDVPFEILHTPGHTKDSVSVMVADRLLTGDTLFLDDGGAGRTDLPGGDPGEQWDSLRRILGLPGHLLVSPAHDYRDRAPSSLALQRSRNPHFAHQNKDAYATFLENIKLGAAAWMDQVLDANRACSWDPHTVVIPSDAHTCETQIDAGTLSHLARITPERLRERLIAGDPILLLDVREPHELTGDLPMLKEALSIPIRTLPERTHELATTTARTLVTVCRSGGRAATAAAILVANGYTDVAVLDGGMLAWHAAWHDDEQQHVLR